MSKALLIREVQERMTGGDYTTADYVDAVFKSITAVCNRGDAVEIRGFGRFSFESKDVKGRDFKSGERITKLRERIVFKASKS